MKEKTLNSILVLTLIRIKLWLNKVFIKFLMRIKYKEIFLIWITILMNNSNIQNIKIFIIFFKKYFKKPRIQKKINLRKIKMKIF